ncbi:Z-ring formation inhibitor MciZ [Brevibacillus dissolubilis]|nr:Z-ring formation inhibitor MciZ [Brevibacillus dissolubilis]
MKTYVSPSSVRMVGKAWEIRATLRGWAGKDMTLSEWLTRMDQAKKRRD